MQLLTFEELVVMAEQRRDKARTPDSVEGWDRLLDVARALAGPGGSTNDLTSGRTWKLVHTRIEGYQGVGGRPLDITFDPTPGVTILRGPNGSGKSSIADAIETALYGSPRAPTAIGSGGRAPLWERNHCGRDATEAVVEVTVVDGAERLVLSCRLGQDGQVIDRRVQRVTDHGSNTDIDLSTTTWASALGGHRPVFGYAAVERQVQLARNLQEFLEPLLAFGGCLEALKSAIEQAGTASAAAKTRWEGALMDAQKAVAGVDRDRTQPDTPSLPDVLWPTINDDPDEWLLACELTETGATVPEVTMQQRDRLHAAATEAVTALDSLEAAEISLHARLAAPLGELHQRALHLADAGDTCPVCRTPDVAWASILGATVNGLVGADAEDTTFRARLRELRQAFDHDLAGLAAVLRQDWCASSIVAAAASTMQRCDELRQALEHDGTRSTQPVRAAVRATHERLVSDEWRATVRELARQSDHRTQWLRARRAAVDSLIATWRNTASDGAAAASWESADRCFRSLQKQLRTTRTEGLQAMTDSAIQTLLRDVGLRVTGLSVQETKATVDVTDESGSPVSLSMLSAGQRNALLLAPLLAVTRSGPFGFLVLDDPVHAFDQIRIDRLARLIHDLADRRRVIVLTHDERLTEHLLACSASYDARAIRRDHATGQVTEEPTHESWRILLADARDVLKLAGNQPGGVTISPTDLVRGLCRMAVDDALRQFVIQQASAADRDPDPDIARLDAQNTTRDRITAAKSLYPTNNAVAEAEPHVAAHMNAWNMAAHGNPATSEAQPAEVDAAEQACSALAARP